MGNIIRFSVIFLTVVFSATFSIASEKKQEETGVLLSPQTQACITCHTIFTPGIVRDWLSSRHSRTKPEDAMKKSILERRISAEKLPGELSEYAVGCFECHSRNPEKHKDNFEHMGFKINVVVSPNDCRPATLSRQINSQVPKKPMPLRTFWGTLSTMH